MELLFHGVSPGRRVELSPHCPSPRHGWASTMGDWVPCSWWRFVHQCHRSDKAGGTPRFVPQSRVVGFPRGMLCSSEAENMPELMPWVRLWVLQAEIWGKMVGADIWVCMCTCVWVR